MSRPNIQPWITRRPIASRKGHERYEFGAITANNDGVGGIIELTISGNHLVVDIHGVDPGVELRVTYPRLCAVCGARALEPRPWSLYGYPEPQQDILCADHRDQARKAELHDLPAPVRFALQRQGICTAATLRAIPDDTLVRVRLIGPVRLRAIRAAYPYAPAKPAD